MPCNSDVAVIFTIMFRYLPEFFTNAFASIRHGKYFSIFFPSQVKLLLTASSTPVSTYRSCVGFASITEPGFSAGWRFSACCWVSFTDAIATFKIRKEKKWIYRVMTSTAHSHKVISHACSHSIMISHARSHSIMMSHACSHRLWWAMHTAIVLWWAMHTAIKS